MYPCANCSAIAEYTYRLNETVATHYCDKHLPNFLNAKKVAGLLPLMTPPVKEEKAPKKKVEAVTEEPTVEEAVAEDSTSTDADS
jgi:hypothetical protein